MDYTTVSAKPSKYLVHWQCSPAEWHTFGKAYWKIKRCWLLPTIAILNFSLLLILLLQNTSQIYENILNGNIATENIFGIVIAPFFCIFMVVFAVQQLKSDYNLYQKLHTKPVNIYIDRTYVIMGSRKYKIGRLLVKERCRLTIGKSGRPSLLILKALRYRKGFRIETIFVPVSQKYESEAIELPRTSHISISIEVKSF